MATYYCRADGTAANKAAATGPANDASKCMTFAVANGETFSAGDIIYISDQGGIFLEILIPPSSGVSGNPITFIKVTGETPIISGSNNEAGPSYERAFCIEINSKNYVTIDGIEYRYSGGAGANDGQGLYVSGTSTGIIVQNCNGHHHKNEALKLVDTASVKSNNNEFHDNLDSDISQHDSTTLESDTDELYNSPYGIENIGSSDCTVIDVDCHDFTSIGIYGLINNPTLDIRGGLIDGKGGLVSGISVANDATVTANDVIIQNCTRGALLNSSGTNYITECTIITSTSYGVDCTLGTNYVNDNIFQNAKAYGIINRVNSVLRAFRNLFDDVAGVYGSGMSLSGLFYCAGNVHNNDASYAYYVIGTVNANSIIANNYVNSSALRGLEANNLIFRIYNNAIRNCVQTNYRQIGNCVVYNNIGDLANLPAGNGNVNSATFANIFQSLVDTDADYAEPIAGGIADGRGIDNGIVGFLTYYNDEKYYSNIVDVGALGIARNFAKLIGTLKRRKKVMATKAYPVSDVWLTTKDASAPEYCDIQEIRNDPEGNVAQPDDALHQPTRHPSSAYLTWVLANDPGILKRTDGTDANRIEHIRAASFIDTGIRVGDTDTGNNIIGILKESNHRIEGEFFGGIDHDEIYYRIYRRGTNVEKLWFLGC